MKKAFLLLPIILGLVYIITTGYSEGPASLGSLERTGATGTIGCGGGSGCHSASATSAIAVTIELDSAGTPVTQYVPGVTYTIKITGVNNTTSGSLPRFGFQLTAVSATGAGTSSATNVGTFSSTLPSSCQNSVPSGSFHVIEHNVAIVSTTGSGSGSGATTYSESITWTAPSAGTGTVKLFGVINAVNYDHSESSADLWNNASATISELVTPVAPITGVTTTCVSSTTTLSDTSTGGTWTSSATSIATVSSTGVVYGVATGTATISYTRGSVSATTTVTITSTPSVGTISGPTTVCTGKTIAITSTVSGGTWSVSGFHATVGSTTGIATGRSSGTATISYVVTSGCGTATGTYPITVLPGPHVGAVTSSSSLVCSGSTLSLSDTSTFGSWSLSNVTVASISSSGVVSAHAVGTDTARYIESIGACSDTGSYAFSIITTPTAGLISIITDTVCTGATITYYDTTSSGGTGIWSSASPAIATVDSVTGVILGDSTGTTTITYTVTNICGSTSGSRSVYVRAAPNAGVITGGSTLCSGGTLMLNDTVSGGTWTSTDDTVATVSGTGTMATVSAHIPGTTVIKYTISSTYCGLASATDTVTVTSTASAGTISGASSLCTGSATTLSETLTGGTWSSRNTAIATINSSGMVFGVSPGVDTISYFTTSSCGAATATFVITVGTAAAGTIFGPTSVCPAGTISLSDTSGTAGGTWTSSTTSIATVGATTGIVTGVSTGVDTIVYTTPSTGCGTASTSYVITVSAGSGAGTISGPTAVCTGSTISLATTGTTGGTWTSTSTSTATVVSTTGLVTGVTAGVDTIKYNVSAGCGSALATYVVTVNTTPVAGTLSGARSVCTGSTTTITDAGSSSTGTWSTTSSSIATVGGATGVVSGVTSGLAIITYSVTSASCGTASDTFAIAVNVTPVAGTISGTSTFCTGQTTTLTDASGTTGGTWSSTATGVATIDATTGFLTASGAGTSTIKYTVISASCGTVVATYPITVNAAPDAGTISGSNNVCISSTVSLTSSGSTGGTWFSGNTSIATVGSTSGTVGGVATGTTTIIYVVTTASCGNDTARFTFTVNPIASAGTISGPTTVCTGTTIPLTDGVAGGTWTSAHTSLATVSTSGVVGGVAGGADTIYYSVSSCGSASVSYPITVIDMPSAGTISGTLSFCAGTSVTLTDAAGGGTWSSSDTTIATVSGSGSVMGAAAGSAIISYTKSNSCGSVSATAAITVKPLPDTGVISGTASICIGSPSILSETATGGAWSSSATSVATVDASGKVFGATAGSAVISYSVSNGCGTFAATFPVTITSSPSAGTITGTMTVCENATTTLSDGVSGGSWSSSAAGTATVDASGKVYGVSAGSVTISYTVAGSCGTVVATAGVTVKPLPVTGTISGISVFCSTSTVTLSETVGAGIWSSGTTSIATVDGSGNVFGVSAGVDTIYYTVSNACGALSATYPVTVETTPSAGTISGPGSLCTGSVITLTDGISGGTWNSASTTTATVDAGGNVTGVAVGSVLISYTVTNTCGSATTSTSITVNLTASAGTITGPTAVCEGATISLSDATGSGTWSSSSTTNATVDASGTVYGVLAGTTTITYTVTATCGTASTTYNITINPRPVAGTISGSTTACTGIATALTDAAGGGTWSSVTTSVATIDASGNVYGVTTGTTTISYTVTNSCGTVAATRVETINLSPVAGTITGSGTVCEAATTTLTDGATGGSWTSGATGTATVTAGGIVTGVAAGAVTISYSVTNSCGTANATFALTVNPLPVTGTISGSATACTGGSATILTDAAGGGTWSSTTTSVATVDASGNVYGATAGTTTISYTVTNSCGTRAATMTETVLVTPTAGAISAISGATIACAGTTVTLTDATTGGSWTSGATSVATVDGTGVVTGVSAGTADISYTISNACGSASMVQTETVATTPTVGPISGLSTLCAGDSITLTDGTAGGTWRSSAAAVATAGASTGVIYGVAAGTANITYTIVNACGSAAVLHSITVNSIPSAGSITGPGSVCPGVTIALSDATVGGSWTSGSTANATVSATGVVTGVTAGTAVITYGIGSACGTGYATYAITVNADPFAGVITGASAVCIGATITLSDTTSGGTWSSGGVSMATVDASGIVTGVSGGTLNIIYSVTNVCGTVSAAHSITVDTLPVPGVISGTDRLCVGTIAALTSTIHGGVWSVSNGHAGISTGGIISGISSGIDTVYYTMLSSTCHSVSTSYIDTVDGVLTSGALAGPDSVCAGDTLHLVIPVPWGTWGTSNGNATVDAAGEVVGVHAGWDTLVYAVTNSCGFHSTTLYVYVRSASECGTAVTPVAGNAVMTLYPNPNQGTFVLEIPATNADATITITDMLGKTVVTRTVDNTSGSRTTFNLAGMAAGNYLIRVNSGSEIFRTKVVVE